MSLSHENQNETKKSRTGRQDKASCFVIPDSSMSFFKGPQWPVRLQDYVCMTGEMKEVKGRRGSRFNSSFSRSFIQPLCLFLTGKNLA